MTSFHILLYCTNLGHSRMGRRPYKNLGRPKSKVDNFAGKLCRYAMTLQLQNAKSYIYLAPSALSVI